MVLISGLLEKVYLAMTDTPFNQKEWQKQTVADFVAANRDKGIEVVEIEDDGSINHVYVPVKKKRRKKRA